MYFIFFHFFAGVCIYKLRRTCFTCQGTEESVFWKLFGGRSPDFVIKESSQTDVEYHKPVLYKVGLGMGYLELPQVVVVALSELFCFMPAIASRG